MNLNLSGRRAPIPGGSRGIGRATAGVLAAEGCAVTRVGRDQATLAAAEPSAALQVPVETITADLARQTWRGKPGAANLARQTWRGRPSCGVRAA